MSHKLHFDVEKSLKLAPPQSYYSQFEGVNFLKRIVIQRDLVTWDWDDQPREEDSDDKRVQKSKTSYQENGFVYTKTPQAITKDPKRKEKFLGRAGFGRNAAQDELEWETCIYDVLSFDSPLAEEAFKWASNDTDDHLPAEANSEASLLKAVVNAIEKGTIKDNEKEIMNFLMRIAKSKGVKRHKQIYSKLRNEEISEFPTMKSWSSYRATEFAKKNNLPYKGDVSQNSSSLGYCSKTTSFKTIFWDSMKKSVEYLGKPVSFITWVSKPKPTLLSEQRKAILTKYNEMIDTLELFVSKWLDIPILEIKKKRNRFPIQFNGFLPQNIKKTPEKNGGPAEDTLVDKDGNIWKRIDK